MRRGRRLITTILCWGLLCLIGLYAARMPLARVVLDPGGGFDARAAPPAPDYAGDDAWLRPPGTAAASGRVDVFYVHPTTYFVPAGLNADAADGPANWALEAMVLPAQLSVFERCCRISAPRYRQAMGGVFLHVEDGATGALDLAYGDVKRAFAEFLSRRPPDAPLILAGHSQGALHGQRLLTDPSFDAALAGRLVAAYLIGYPARRSLFDGRAGVIAACATPTSTGCLVTWMSVRHRGTADQWTDDAPVWTGRRYERNGGWPTICVNPLSWHVDGPARPAGDHLGARVGETIVPGLIGAECRDGVLRVDDPGRPALTFHMWPGGDFHPIEFSLFQADLAANIADRVAAHRGR